MTRETILHQLLETKIVAIIRLRRPGNVIRVAEALLDGGVNAIEITMGTPHVFQELEKLAGLPGILPGVGSVIDAASARQAISVGAEFVVTPVSKLEVISEAHAHGKPVLSGALTPTEMVQAHEWGADVVKLFPAASFGLSYFKAVKAPLPQIPIMPTGGVTVENASEWIRNGAVCLGIGGSIVNDKRVEEEDFETITRLARSMREAVDHAD